jgi:hypothetical protein
VALDGATFRLLLFLLLVMLPGFWLLVNPLFAPLLLPLLLLACLLLLLLPAAMRACVLLLLLLLAAKGAVAAAPAARGCVAASIAGPAPATV